MRSVTVNHLGAEAQGDSVWHDEEYEARRFTATDVSPPPFAPKLHHTAFVAVFWLITLGVFWLGGWWSEREFAYAWRTFWHALLAVTALLPLVGIVGIGIAWWRERATYIARARLTRDRLQNPIPADLAASLTHHQYLGILERMAVLEEAVAPYRVYRGVESVNVHAPMAAKPTSPARADEGVIVEPPDVWLPAALDEAHLLLAGRTSCGKTTTAEALLAHVIDAGEAVLVIDPHWQPGKWHHVDAIGAGRDYAAIRHTLRALVGEMTARFQRLAKGESVGDPATVIIDEAPAIASELASEWKALATRLGSEARKARIRLILLTQSPLVEDLGVNSVMRRNFAVIGLDTESIRLMLRGADVGARQATLARLEGEPYPALREAQGVFRVLERRGIDRIAPRAEARVWRVPMPEGEEVQTNKQASVAHLAHLVRSGYTRDQARAAGETFDDRNWAEARKVVDEERRLLGDLLTSPPAYACPKCGRALTISQYGAAKRHGSCKQCKEAAK